MQFAVLWLFRSGERIVIFAGAVKRGRTGDRIGYAGLAGPSVGTQHQSISALNGKTVKPSGGHLAGAISLLSHRCLEVEPVADKSNEIPTVQTLLERAAILAGQMVSLDALHTQHKTVLQILYDKGADYLVPIAGNQPTLLQTAQQLLPESVPPSGGEGGG